MAADKMQKYNITLRTHDTDCTSEAAANFGKRGLLALEIGDDDRVSLLLANKASSVNLTLTIPNEDMLHLIERYVDALKNTGDVESEEEGDGSSQNPAFAKSLARLKTIIKRA